MEADTQSPHLSEKGLVIWQVRSQNLPDVRIQGVKEDRPSARRAAVKKRKGSVGLGGGDSKRLQPPGCEGTCPSQGREGVHTPAVATAPSVLNVRGASGARGEGRPLWIPGTVTTGASGRERGFFPAGLGRRPFPARKSKWLMISSTEAHGHGA